MTAPPTSRAIGNRLQRLRVALNVSQGDMCKMFGVNHSTWSMYETGNRRPTIDLAYLLKQRFAVSADWLFFGDPHDLPEALFKELV